MSGPDIEHTQTVERTFSNANMLLYWISNLQVKAIFLTISASLFVAIFFLLDSFILFHRSESENKKKIFYALATSRRKSMFMFQTAE